MELKLTKEQEELLIKNYKVQCKCIEDFPSVAKATAKNFLIGCLDGMLSEEVDNIIFNEMMIHATLATLESGLK